MKQTNMYELSVMQWNPFVGCEYNCKYCEKSFQAPLKRFSNCPECNKYIPHNHPERLTKSLKNTKYMYYIFTCSTGDISFCDTEYLNEIIHRIENEKDKTFLIQSKNPLTFNRVKFPKNVILGTTIETNKDDIVKQYSDAPAPSKRYVDFVTVKHPLKMVTMEPIMKFDEQVILRWMQDIDPMVIWMGYDSKNTGLPSPSIDEFKSMFWELSKHFNVFLKRKEILKMEVKES